MIITGKKVAMMIGYLSIISGSLILIYKLFLHGDCNVAVGAFGIIMGEGLIVLSNKDK